MKRGVSMSEGLHGNGHCDGLCQNHNSLYGCRLTEICRGMVRCLCLKGRVYWPLCQTEDFVASRASSPDHGPILRKRPISTRKKSIRISRWQCGGVPTSMITSMNASGSGVSLLDRLDFHLENKLTIGLRTIYDQRREDFQ